MNSSLDPGAVIAHESAWLSASIGATGYRTEIRSDGHTVIADEPPMVGGTSEGPSPYDLLVGALGACTAMTLRMYADGRKWPLEGVTVRIRNSRSHAADCADCSTRDVGIQRLDRMLELQGPLSAEQRETLIRIADRCPVKQSLDGRIEIVPVGTSEPSSLLAAPTEDEPLAEGALLADIRRLLDEERRLQAMEALEAVQLRIRALGEELDQAWDLLHQRRSLAALGLSPDQAEPRPADEIENIRGQ